MKLPWLTNTRMDQLSKNLAALKKILEKRGKG
jgi:hypothetical protein